MHEYDIKSYYINLDPLQCTKKILSNLGLGDDIITHITE